MSGLLFAGGSRGSKASHANILRLDTRNINLLYLLIPILSPKGSAALIQEHYDSNSAQPKFIIISNMCWGPKEI